VFDREVNPICQAAGSIKEREAWFISAALTNTRLGQNKSVTVKDECFTLPAQEIYGDSCGRKGLDETPQCVAQGGSAAARGKRSIFP